jgi:hypothetical protein
LKKLIAQKYLEEQTKAAPVIQRFWRGFAARKLYKKMQLEAIRLKEEKEEEENLANLESEIEKMGEWIKSQNEDGFDQRLNSYLSGEKGRSFRGTTKPSSRNVFRRLSMMPDSQIADEDTESILENVELPEYIANDRFEINFSDSDQEDLPTPSTPPNQDLFITNQLFADRENILKELTEQVVKNLNSFKSCPHLMQ